MSTTRDAPGPTPRGKLALRASVRLQFGVQLAGELLITVGLIVLLFVAWDLWWTNVQADATQTGAAQAFVRELPAAPPLPVEPPTNEGRVDYGPPVVSQAPGHGQTFGVVYIPRFGDSYSRPMAEGIGTDVLDTLGLGHYPTTTMPGAPGNFALAGHRQTHGAVLDNIHTLVPGDKIYVQTKDAFYTYTFRNEQIVLPSRTDVLLPVPTKSGAQPQQSLLTLTSCNPRFGSQERIVAYAVMDSWQPAAAGPPAAIAAQVSALKERG